MLDGKGTYRDVIKTIICKMQGRVKKRFLSYTRYFEFILLLLHYDAVKQLQRNIALYVCCHSTDRYDQMQKYRCHYVCDIYQHTLAPKSIFQNDPSLRLFHWLLRITYFQSKWYLYRDNCKRLLREIENKNSPFHIQYEIE